MIIDVKVNARSKNNCVIVKKGNYRVNLTAKPVDGQANNSLIKLLSEYFDIPKSKISIIKGEKCRNKTLEIGLK